MRNYQRGEVMLRQLLLAIVICAAGAAPGLGADLAPLVDLPPHGDDYAAASLRRYLADIERQYGDYRNIPLAEKAAFFEWQLWRYHRTDYQQVYNRARLPGERGKLPEWLPGSDSSTWNGALLGTLAYKYAVTRDPDTLTHICGLLDGLRLFFEATGQPGLPARNVTPLDGPVADDQTGRFEKDGRKFAFRSQAAKGTVNQLAGGYLTLLLHVGRDLPGNYERMASDDLAAIALHLIEHEYHLTEADGKRTPYGDLTPVVASVGAPFNAQVAYMIVAAAHYFPPDNNAAREKIAAEFNRLRHKHHVYYEEPWGSLLVLPQRIGGSPLVKGMNDRLHVTYAAYLGLELDIEHARQHHLAFDRKLVFQLGQTMTHSMNLLWNQHNSLCNFMWAGLVRDEQVLAALAPRDAERVRRQAEYGLIDGIEQLRRFRLNRFCGPGEEENAREALYNDAHFPDDYYWKVNPEERFRPTGPTGDTFACAIDYLHAYWMLRFLRLDQTAAARQRFAAVLSPGVSR